MQFLNPFVLIGLAAASIPLLLHLLQRRKLRPIEFSTLRFLKELQKTTVRRFKLRQWLLLLLRTLIIAFIVLAFARPALRGTIGGIGAHAHSTVVILLDNSLSMDTRDANGQLFESAQHSATQIADVLEEGDNAALVPMAETALGTTPQLTHDFEQFKRSIAASRIVPHTARIHDALRMAAAMLSSSLNPNKEVYVITDGQRVSFDSISAALPLFDDKTHVIVIRTGDHARRTDDLSIDSLRLLTAVFEPGKALDVEATVRNTGNDDASAAIVRMTLNGRTVAQRTVRVAAHSVTAVPISATLDAVGVVGVAVSVEDNSIEADNTRSAALFVPASIRVALIAENSDAGKFVRSALEPDPDSRGYFAITDVPTTRVGGVNFDAYDVVVFTALPRFGAGDAKRLRAFLERGGGVFMFGGSDVEAYNRGANDAGLPSAQSLGSAGSALMFGSVDLNHPMFAGVFERSVQSSTSTVAESPRLQSMTKFSEEGASETIIRMSNGAPFLMRRSVGQGRVILCAASPTLNESDFPVKPIFVPVVTRGVLYAATLDAVGESISAAEAIDLPIRPEAAQGMMTVRGPDGSETKLQPRVQATSAALPLEGMRRCGVYGLYSQSGTAVGAFAVNPDASEADLTVLGESELTARLATMSGIAPGSVRVVEPGTALAGSILQIRFGVELWRACLYAALLCALLEMVVARTAKQDAIEN